jgi:hypothetical protein
MGPVSEKTSTELRRSDLLQAIDAEIAHRESLTSRHGVNAWGIVAVLASLVWATVNELTAGPHNLTNLILIFLAAYLLLGWLASGSLGKIGKLVTFPADDSQAMSLQARFLRSGFTSRDAYFHVGQLGVLLLLTGYLGGHGYPWFCSFAVLLFASGLLASAFLLLLCHVRLPFRYYPPSFRNRLVTRILVSVALLTGLITIGIACYDVFAAWPALQKEPSDIRLGGILAALAMVFELSYKLAAPPPGLIEFRTLRTRLAFGIIDDASATYSAKQIVCGPSGHDYLKAPVDAAISVFRRRALTCEAIADKCDLILAYADRLRSNANDERLRRDAANFTYLAKQVIADSKAQEALLLQGLQLREKVQSRIITSRGLLQMPYDVIDQMLAQVDESLKASEAARSRVAERIPKCHAACDWLRRYFIEHPVQRKRRAILRDAFDAIFGA